MNNVKLLPALLSFVEVAESKSFTLAAKKLGLSKSAVSQHISRLEESLGVELLTRNTRNMALTAAGQKLLERSQSLRNYIELTFNELHAIEQEPSGPFVLTFPHALQSSICLPALADLCREFPRLEPKLIVSDQRHDLIEEQIDVAIFGGRLKNNRYRRQKMGEMTEIFCASPLFVQRHALPKSPDDLLELNWLATHWHQEKVNIYQAGSKKALHSLKLKRYAQADTLPAVIEMAERSLGFTLLCDVLALPLIREGRLVQLLPEYSGPHWTFHLLHAYQQNKPIHIDRFGQLVRHYFEKAKLR